MLANGVGLLARSFKYHRPRGIFTAGSEEPSALVQLEEGAWTEPNARATMVELYEGLRARSQNCWPSVGFDLGAVAGLFAPLLAAGFYYKTFLWPRAWWKRVYEPLIRHAAGMGQAPAVPDPDRYSGRFAHCDVLVAGGGPAGLAAALAAARAGGRVIIADEQAALGGRLVCETTEIGNQPAIEWVACTLAELEAMPEVTVLPRTTVCGYYDPGYVVAHERVTNHLGPQGGSGLPRERLWRIRARQVVMATGAIERPVVFAGNDRPGTMLADAARTYLRRFGVLVGRNVVVFTNNDSAYGAAFDLAQAGARVNLVDLRSEPPSGLVQDAERFGLRLHPGYAVCATRGRRGVSEALVVPLNADGTGFAGPVRSLRCDALAVSGGWTPSVSLWTQARGTLDWHDATACYRPGTTPEPIRAAGACNGAFKVADCLLQGTRAGTLAARDAGFGDGWALAPKTPNATHEPLRALFAVPAPRGGRSGAPRFVDLQNDVTVADLELAVREGYGSVEHLKRYTTTGMGMDQGKTSSANALALLAGLRDVPVEALGVTTFRPPYAPITFGVVVGQSRGERFEPRRTTPIHPWHEKHGATITHAGGWLRPFAYPRPDESLPEAVQRECAEVRSSAGLFDASTLGKIDVQGPDAASFLDRVYTNRFSNLELGRCRYGLMLNDEGMVMDDGVTTRLGEHHFHMTTTTGGVSQVLAWLEEWLQTEWPELDVYLADVTEQWAVAVLCGPRARHVLQALTDIDLDLFPFMAFSEGTLAGVPARVFRVSFTGELSYEINVPARYGQHLWEVLVERGEAFGLCPFGTEALHVLRAERGFIVVGQETDGTVTPMDLGLGPMVANDKGDFIGRRSLARPELAQRDRRQLVGMLTADPGYVLSQGVHLVENAHPQVPVTTLGHVTSSYMSPNVGRSIALALVESGRRRVGETLYAFTREGHAEPVEVTAPVFLDPRGERARG